MKDASMTAALRQFFQRVRSLFRGPQLGGDLDAEMAAHLDLATQENIQRGMSSEQARRQALMRFGGVEQAKQRHRDERSLPTLDELTQDLRYALRTFRRDRTFILDPQADPINYQAPGNGGRCGHRTPGWTLTSKSQWNSSERH